MVCHGRFHVPNCIRHEVLALLNPLELLSSLGEQVASLNLRSRVRISDLVSTFDSFNSADFSARVAQLSLAALGVTAGTPSLGTQPPLSSARCPITGSKSTRRILCEVPYTLYVLPVLGE